MSLPEAAVFDNDGLTLDTETVWSRAEVEAAPEALVDDRLGAEQLARQARGVQRAHARARHDELEGDLERDERPAGRARLLLAAGRQAPVVIGPRTVGLGLAVSQKPELLRHQPESSGRRLTQLFTSGPRRSARGAPNSASISPRRSSSISSQSPATPSRQ